MSYRANYQIVAELEKLFDLYEYEVERRKEDRCLKPSSAASYLTHTRHFIRWCKGEFVPGGKKLQNNKNEIAFRI